METIESKLNELNSLFDKGDQQNGMLNINVYFTPNQLRQAVWLLKLSALNW